MTTGVAGIMHGCGLLSYTIFCQEMHLYTDKKNLNKKGAPTEIVIQFPKY